MELKEIELVTLEAMKEVAKEEFGDDFDVDAPVDPDDMRFMVKVMTRFLARVKEEEGKDAVAEVVSVEPYGMAVRAIGLGRMATKSYITLKEGDLLFLSPTIPAGYALVPIEPTSEMQAKGRVWMGHHPLNVYKAMLAGVTK